MSVFKHIIDKRVDERINEILKSRRDFKFRKISDAKARKEISSFILEKKSESITKLSILDFVLSLRLPAEQVSKILDGFEKEKKIKEINA